MTEQEMRIAIAEACGWRNVQPNPVRGIIPLAGTIKPGGVSDANNPPFGIPDYLNDLNAMHEAEKVLDQNQKNRYLNILHGICLPEDYDELDDDFNWCTATARQRAEAFVETLNLRTE